MPLDIISGEIADISEYLGFGPYYWVVYKLNSRMVQVELGRWLGVSHRVFHLISYCILSDRGIPISFTVVQ